MTFLFDLIGLVLGPIVFAVISGFLCLVLASAMHASGLMVLTYAMLAMGALLVIGAFAFCVIEVKDHIRYKNLNA